MLGKTLLSEHYAPKPWAPPSTLRGIPLTARPFPTHMTYLHIAKKFAINKKKQQWHVHGSTTSVTKPNEHNDKPHHSSGIKCATQLDLVHIPLALVLEITNEYFQNSKQTSHT